MTTARKNGPASPVSRGADLLVAESPDIDAKTRERASNRRVAVDDAKIDDAWAKIIDSRREGLDTDVLAITPPRTKLDPIAQGALQVLVQRLIDGGVSRTHNGEKAEKKTAERAASSPSPEDIERKLRQDIVTLGIASEVKKVTERLNARRITGGRLWVLRTTYAYLLAKLLAKKSSGSASRNGKNHDGRSQIEGVKRLIKDDLGVAEKVLLDLAAEGGPLDVFADLVVRSVVDRNRIALSKTRLRLVSQYVRSAI